MPVLKELTVLTQKRTKPANKKLKRFSDFNKCYDKSKVLCQKGAGEESLQRKWSGKATLGDDNRELRPK